mmetsp:Transcript_19956/g.22285  ORF Transcript_19956/g.22285 Transcript_19956/m.22285 type:complete len:159 (+) Transcript_19956:507-983(+)
MKQKYKRILFISDTCEAFSWFSFVNAPNIMYEASSGVGESAYSHGWDDDLQVSVSDKYSFSLIKYLKGKFLDNFKKQSILSFFESFDSKFLGSDPVHNHTLIDSKTEHEAFINFFPTPFTKESSSLLSDTLKYSVFERVKKFASEEEYKIAADFVMSL